MLVVVIPFKEVAHRVGYLEQGVLVEFGTPERMFNNPRHESTRTFLERVRYEA